jgi:hypothetical protein
MKMVVNSQQSYNCRLVMLRFTSSQGTDLVSGAIHTAQRIHGHHSFVAYDSFLEEENISEPVYAGRQLMQDRNSYVSHPMNFTETNTSDGILYHPSHENDKFISFEFSGYRVKHMHTCEW